MPRFAVAYDHQVVRHNWRHDKYHVPVHMLDLDIQIGPGEAEVHIGWGAGSDNTVAVHVLAENKSSGGIGRGWASNHEEN